MSKLKTPTEGDNSELKITADTNSAELENKESEVEKNINSFVQLEISTKILEKLTELSFLSPTKIQSDVIPVAISGRDILASSKTGSGKTLSFCIPSIEKILNQKEEGGQILILAPTREIAMQVSKVVESIGKGIGIHYALLIGGDNMLRQLDQLKKRPQIIIGTPGRVNDHLDRKSLKLQSIISVVLDEADKMLDMGFDVQIDGIMKGVKKECQFLMFSATLSKRIEELSRKYLKNPKIILNAEQNTSENDIKKVKQEFLYHSSFEEKKKSLLESVQADHEAIIIFVKTKSKTEEIADLLEELGHAVDCLHGDLKQSVRSKVISKFRDKKYKILVATDVAARGLDIPHISLVINFDMPMCFEDYVHRIGRTNRESGASGYILNFVSPVDNRMANEVRSKLGHNVKPMKEEDSRRRSGGRGFGSGSRFRSSGGGSRFGSSSSSKFGNRDNWRSSERSSDTRSSAGKFGFSEKKRSSSGSSFGGFRKKNSDR